MNYIKEYYDWIQNNPNKVCQKIKKIYKKLVEDIKTPKKVSITNKESGELEVHTYVFDEEKGSRPIDFIEKYCRHSKGKWAGKPVRLELFEKACIQAAYGFVDKDTRLRKYKKVGYFVGRKNGKSLIGSGIGNYMLTKDGEGGAEVYSLATKKDQAKIVWEEAKKMIKKSPALRQRCKCRVTGIFYDKTDSVFKALASDSNSLDGANASCVIADEIHAWRDQNLLDVMEDSMTAREQPMIFELSSMGTVREAVFDNEYEYFEQVINGTIEDETVLPIIYELDKPEEWKDEECWYKANPGLGVIKNIKTLREKVNKAKNDIKKLPNLLCKDFNVRQNEQDKWLTFEIANNEETYKVEDLFDTYAIGGVDLSSTTDLTCATLLIVKGKKKYVIQQYFIPSERLEFKIIDDKIPYDIWEKRGLVTVCEGAKVNYSDVTAWFLKMHNEFDISALWVGYDPWGSEYWINEMKECGFDMVEVRQGAKTMSNPMKEVEADLIEKNINYNNNPVLKWCLCNTVEKRDENDNIRPVKGKKSRARIDGAVSLIIAYCVLFEKMNEYLSMQGE